MALRLTIEWENKDYWIDEGKMELREVGGELGDVIDITKMDIDELEELAEVVMVRSDELDSFYETLCSLSEVAGGIEKKEHHKAW